MVPEGWAEATLGSLLEFKNGFNTDKSNYGHGTPFINVSEVLKYASMSADQIPGMVNVTEKEASANAVVRGDILFNRTSETPEEVGFTSVYLDDVPVVFGGFVIRGRPTSDALHPEFGQYAMRQPMVRYEIIRRSQGAVRSNIGQGELSKVSVQLPPLPEQRKIVDILSTWDEAIEKTEALLTNARTQKRALMQQLLTGKRRFPEFEGQQWKEVLLGDVVKLSKQRLNTKQEHNARRCIELEHIESETGRLVGATSSDLQASTKAVFGLGDVLYGKLRPYLRKFHAPEFEGVCSTEIWVLQADLTKLDPSYLYCLVQSEGFQEQADKSSGSKMPRADWKVVSGYSVALPSLPEQKIIADVFKDMGSEIDAIVNSITNLRTEKKALMQQLLTGKLRVKVEDGDGI